MAMELLRSPTSALVLVGIAAGAACTDASTVRDDPAAGDALFERAICVLQPTAGHRVRGVVRFTSVDEGGVRVEAEVEGLNPGGRHGFHIHELGDLSDGSGKSLGGHYNPEAHDHGLPERELRHAGDLGNLVAGDDGRASYSATFENFSLGGHNDVIGRGLVVHVGPDDGGQPTGNAGARAGVGVIGIAR